ncbi:hypothetical protein ES702_04819 [subsurface metagenome]
MVSMKLQFTWKIVLLPAVGLLAFFLYLYIFNVDIPKIIATVQRIDVSFYLLAVAAVILETFFFALSWRSLLSFLSVKLSVRKSFLYIWFGIFIDTVIPAESVSGEISRVYLVTREQNEATGKVVASLVTQRLMGMGINVVSLFIGATALLMRHQLGGIVLNLTMFLAVSTLIFLVLLLLLCVKERWTLKIIDAVIRFAEYVTRGRWKLKSVRKEVVKAAKAFYSAMKEFGRAPRTLFTPAFFSVLSWIFSLAVAYLVFCSIGFPWVHWSVIIVTCSIVAAVKAIPLGVPFEAGLPEITMATLYMVLLPEIPLDIRLTICGTATILTRILTVWLRFFIGFAVQQWLGVKAITTR